MTTLFPKYRFVKSRKLAIFAIFCYDFYMLDLSQIYLNLIQFQYLILFLVVAIEGPIISVIAGLLIAQGQMNLYYGLAIIIFADLFGDVIYYFLGRRSRNFGMKILRVTPQKLSELEGYFHDHGGKTMFIGKLAHGIGSTFLFAAGVAKMPFRKFLYYNVLATIPKSIILIVIGYLFGRSFVRIGDYFDYYALFTLILGASLILIYIAIARRLKKERSFDYSPSTKSAIAVETSGKLLSTKI